MNHEEEDYGQKLIIESIIDLSTRDQHYDASWVGTAAQVGLDIRFHYERQKRKRKLLALIVRAEEDETEEAHRACAAIFDDIRTSIQNNTALFYTRGIRTPQVFHAFSLTVPPLEGPALPAFSSWSLAEKGTQS
jgi:hypothetical protein